MIDTAPGAAGAIGPAGPVKRADRAPERRCPERRCPERRCIATGEVLPIDGLLRFVVGPEGNLVADLGRELPGRGIWVGGRRELLERAMKKRLFARAAKATVMVAEDLPDQVETAMRRRCLALLGLAKRAGQLTLGYEKVRAALAADRTAIVVTAHDSSLKGRQKLLSGTAGGSAEGASPQRVVVDMFMIDELSLALGRENVVHAALRAGGLADRFVSECHRLADFSGESSSAGMGGPKAFAAR
ncbi:MAG: RNA-binding protein [Alphaproteobacteria bacterium]|nr:RNA-binding protein [Alphaproteobacteria bacterium]MBL6952214.1 RNA-binding protein [Alphaproteobacteria bacterium]